MSLTQYLPDILAAKGRTSPHVRDRLSAILSELDKYSATNPVFADDLFDALAVQNQAWLEHMIAGDLDLLVINAGMVTGLRKDILDRIHGYLPPSEVVIDLVESSVQGGKITGLNLWEANTVCLGYVQAATNPRFEHFICQALAEHLQPNGDLQLTVGNMVDFLKDDYDPFSKRVANGLIARAGKLNEMILERALINASIGPKGTTYDVTGTKSKGDVVFYYNNSVPPSQLYAEIKSYGARERLLRGLTDLNHKDSIGVGFFTNASEFNPTRTQDFLNTGSLAIYLPDHTYDKLHATSKACTSKRQQPFYRKLSDFPSDIVHFTKTGVLP